MSLQFRFLILSSSSLSHPMTSLRNRPTISGLIFSPKAAVVSSWAGQVFIVGDQVVHLGLDGGQHNENILGIEVGVPFQKSSQPLMK